MAEYETVIYEERDHVAWITMNRPEVLNAFNYEMQTELSDIWARVGQTPEVHCAVLTGTGRGFCVGVDRKDFFATGRVLQPLNNHIAPKAMGCWKPIIAAINGMAAGGAFYMLGEADILICSEVASFFDPHVTYGMVSGQESMHMVQKMPFGDVVRMQLMGNDERLSAKRALEIGLVSQIVPGDQLLATAGQIAAAIAKKRPEAVQGTLRALWAAKDLPRHEAFALGGLIFAAHGARGPLNEDPEYQKGQEEFAAGTRVDYSIR
jgi:enoyl-CoA hydratase/carnithine racemase